MKRRTFYLAFLIFLCFSIAISNLPFEPHFPVVPKVYASPDGSYFWDNKVDIPLPDGVTISTWDVCETSYGIFVTDESGHVYRTTDDGETWDIIYTWTNPVGSTRILRTVENWVLVKWNGPVGGTNIIVCKDGVGDSWQSANDTITVNLRDCLIQLSNGTFYAGLNGGYIMRSDDGLNWFQWVNTTQVLVDLGATPYEDGEDWHSHAMAWDPIREVFYLAGGDTVSGTSWAGSGKVIIYMTNDGVWHGLDPNKGAGVGAVATKEGVIWGMDHACVDLHKSWYGNDTYLYLQDALGAYTYISHLAFNNEVVYVAITAYTANTIGLYASPDYGRNWVTVVEESSSTDDYYVGSGCTSDSILVWKQSSSTQTLWRLYNPDPKELLHYLNQEYVSISDSTYTFTKDVGNNTNWLEYNGTDYIDASSYSITSANITFTGVSYRNLWNNTSFEDGTTDWSFTGTDSYGTTTDQAKYGSNSLELNKSTETGNFDIHADSAGWTTVLPDERYTISVWLRANITPASYPIEFYQRQMNSTGSATSWSKHAMSFADVDPDTWARKHIVITTNLLDDVDRLIFKLRFRNYENITWHIDGFMLDRCNLARPEKEHSHYNLVDWFDGTLNTTDPSVTIGGQTISHSGELTDGQQSSTTSITLVTGVTTVSEIHVKESGIVKITISAAVDFAVTNVFLREKSGVVYLGRRYNTSITIPASISSLICISDGLSNITTGGSWETNYLAFTISGWSGQTSSSMVYTAGRGEPVTLAGATSSYDAVSDILTLTVSHSSAVEVNMSWVEAGNDQYTEGDNSTWGSWTESYNSPLRWSSESQVDSYSLNVTKTGHANKIYLFLTLDSAINVSDTDYFSFWLKSEVETTFTLYAYEVGTANSYYFVGATRIQWDLYVVRLKSFTVAGSPSWGTIKKFWFKWNSLTGGQNETFLIDGMHFASYSQSGATNSIDETMLPQFGYFTHLQSRPAAGSYPESVYMGRKLDDSILVNGLETEALGQTLYFYCYAYNLTGYDFYLDMAEIYGNALYHFQNDTEGTRGYGGFAYGRADDGQRFLVNAWIHNGITFLYHLTGNSTYQTMCQRHKRWMVDLMWNSTNSWFEHHYEPDTDDLQRNTIFVWTNNAVGAGALSLYTKYVEANVTLDSIVHNVMGQCFSDTGFQRHYSIGLTESDSYGYWGIYNCYLGYGNVSYRENFLNASHRWLLVNLRNPNRNGSITASEDRFWWYDDTDGRIAGWGHMVGLYHLCAAYDITGNSLWSNLLSKMLWDYIYSIKTDNGYGSVPIYLNAVGSYGHYNQEQYTPTSGAVLICILWYYENIATPSTTSGAYVVDSTKNITASSHTATTLTFTVNASSGNTSITRVYCGNQGNPTSVTGADSYSYDYSDSLLTVTVTHSSLQQVIISWEEEDGDEDGDDQIEPPPVGYHDLKVYVLWKNGTIIPHEKVTLFYQGYFWYSLSDTNGTAVFRNLVEGRYDVTIWNHTKNVDVPFYDSVTFEFESPPASTWWDHPLPRFIKEHPILIVAIVCVILIIGLLPTEKKRKNK